jgi:hypothetical protein
VQEFGTVNFAVVVIYLVVIVGVGSSFYRRKTTTKEYFLDREIQLVDSSRNFDSRCGPERDNADGSACLGVPA